MLPGRAILQTLTLPRGLRNVCKISHWATILISAHHPAPLLEEVVPAVELAISGETLFAEQTMAV